MANPEDIMPIMGIAQYGPIVIGNESELLITVLFRVVSKQDMPEKVKLGTS